MTKVRAGAHVFCSLCALVVALAGLGGHLAAATPGSPSDPGGHILAELSAIRHAVPADAADVHKLPAEPVITSSCDTTRPSVTERIVFRSRRPVAQVQADVSAAMRRAGWMYTKTFRFQGVTGGLLGQEVPSTQSVVEWSRRLPTGPAGAQLEVAVPLQGWHAGRSLQWLLAASATGVHLPTRHCGSP